MGTVLEIRNFELKIVNSNSAKDQSGETKH